MPNQMTMKGGAAGISQAAVQSLIDTSIAGVSQFKIPYDRILLNDWFDQTILNDSYFAGTGSADFTLTLYRQQTGATAASASTSYKTINPSANRSDWSKKRQINYDIQVVSPTDNVMLGYYNCGAKLTDQHFGFEISGGKLKATCGSGTAQSTTDIESLAAGGFNKTWSLKAIFYPGVKVEYYKDGTLVATITTNLPVAGGFDTQILYFSTRNSTSAENKQTLYGACSYFEEA